MTTTGKSSDRGFTHLLPGILLRTYPRIMSSLWYVPGRADQQARKVCALHALQSAVQLRNAAWALQARPALLVLGSDSCGCGKVLPDHLPDADERQQSNHALELPKNERRGA